MKKSFLFLVIPLLLVGCGKKEEEQEHAPIPDPTPTPQPQPEPEPTGVKVVKILTSGDSYKAKFTNGTQFGSGHSANIQNLTSFLNEQTTDGDLITSLECVSLNSLDDVEKDGYRYLTIGSAKATGSLEINTKYGVTDVKVECMNYNNTYSGGGGGYNCDRNSHLLIDSNDNPLELNDTETPSLHEFETAYLEPVNSFAISSSGGRVFVKSITITYYA